MAAPAQSTSKPKSPSKSTQALAGELRTSVGLLLRRLRQITAEGELTLPESSALARLDRGGPATASELARREQISPQSIGATLAALEARGLVGRASDPDDGRRVILSAHQGRRRGPAQPPQREDRADGRRPRGRVQRRGAGATARRGAAGRAARPEHLTPAPAQSPADRESLGDGYKWTALANTTAAVFMSTLDGSIVLIAMPAIFRGIHLDPLAPENIVYLLWMIMGYRLVQAVLVVSVGRMGDMFGRVRIYNAGFVDLHRRLDPALGRSRSPGKEGALWLIGWRLLQALGGSMLTANSAAILTDAFPAEQRGFALGINQVAGIAGQFIGLVAGGAPGGDRLARGVLGQRAGRRLRHRLGLLETARDERPRRRADRLVGQRHLRRRARARSWSGSPTGSSPTAATPWAGPTRWCSPRSSAAHVLLAAFAVIETRVAEPMFHLSLFKIRAFTAGSVAASSPPWRAVACS